MLPRPADDGPVGGGDRFLTDFLSPFVSFFRMRGIVWILLFLLFFRLAEAQLGKIAVLFLQDKPEAGGSASGSTRSGFSTGPSARSR